MKSVPRSVFAAVLALGLFFGASSPSYAFLDKTRFAAHLGVAYFCFHHWVLYPYQHGAFSDGAPHRTIHIIKGGAALLFAVHEVRVAKKIADSSNDPLLHGISLKLAGMMGSFDAIGTKLKSGKFDPSDIQKLTGQTDSVGSDAAADGAAIHDVPVAVPGS